MAKDIIKEAIDFETKGRDLYLSLKKKATNKITKALFDSLARQEKDHIAYIKEFAKTHKFKKLKYISIKKNIQTVYKSLKKEEKELLKNSKSSNISGYKLALKLEDKGYKMYSQAALKAQDKQEKQFFQFLMNMEQEHYESLANVYFYFTKNDEWLAENESKVWNWMNL